MAKNDKAKPEAPKTKRACSHPNRAERRRRALERQAARGNRSAATQLKRLRARIKTLNEQAPGRGGAATRETEKLKALIKKEKTRREDAKSRAFADAELTL